MARGKPIRVGVVGVGRGQTFMQTGGEAVGMKLVAICDIWEERLKEVGKTFGVATYTEFEKFLTHDMDAVVLANYFNEHAPFAVRALEAGHHVMSETACNTTLAEGVALCRAVEKSGRIYMLAENYPYTAFAQEMRRIYRTGEIGKLTYAEGEYNHPMSLEDRLRISPGMNHWRWWLPSTYYCTHALAPLVSITNQMPVRVSALSIACAAPDVQSPRRGDVGSVILCRTEDGGVFRILGLSLPGHSNWYRVHGELGAMETTRGPGYFGPGQVRVWHEEWDLEAVTRAAGAKVPTPLPVDRAYVPEFPEHAELANRAGHGGGDFWTAFHFAAAIRDRKQPFLDVYRGVGMSSVGILAWKSALEEGKPVVLPDFRDEQARRPFENDHWSPWPNDQGPGQPPPSILGHRRVPAKAVSIARKAWREIGYTGE